MLEDLTNSCSSLAKELSACLKALSSSPNQGQWRTLRQALKTKWSEQKINVMSNRLRKYRDELQFRILVAMKENMNVLLLRQDSRFFQLGETERVIVHAVVAEGENIATKLRSDAIDVIDRLESNEARAAQRHDESMEAIHSLQIAARVPDQMIPYAVVTQPRKLTYKRSWEKRAHIEAVAKTMVKMLGFARRTDRKEDIAKAHAKTFRWIYSEASTKGTPWSSFSEWLRSGSRCYWINGKAGSGKSTLMKYITTADKTINMLSHWGHRTIMASFYLWNSGTDLQKTKTGMFRSLLFDILKESLPLVEVLFSEWLERTLYRTVDLWLEGMVNVPVEMPSEGEIARAFRSLLHHRGATRICLFIDGVDELEGDPSELAQLLLSVTSPTVKIAVSSRPIAECVDAFKESPQLRLQDLTRPDMKAYVNDRLHSHSRMQELMLEVPEEVSRLKEEIVEKSTGVFLWTVLVTKSLISGFQNFDTVGELARRLGEFPPELMDLYRHMIKRMDPFYREQASQLLQIAYHSVEVQREIPLSAAQLYFANAADPESAIRAPMFPKDERARRIGSYPKIIEGRLRSRCCGLLEIDHRQNVTFLHRTVIDFLRDVEVWNYILSLNIDADFDVNVSLLSSCLALLKMHVVGAIVDSRYDSIVKDTHHCLTYCALAQKTTNRSQARFLEELNHVMHQHWASVEYWQAKDIPLRAAGPDWTLIIPYGGRHYNRYESFLLVLIHYGLVLFIQERWTANYQRLIGVHDRLLLIGVLRELASSKNIAQQTQICKDQVQILRFLLASGVDPNATSDDILHPSAWKFLLINSKYIHPGVIDEVVKLFVEAGADVNAIVGEKALDDEDVLIHFPSKMSALDLLQTPEQQQILLARNAKSCTIQQSLRKKNRLSLREIFRSRSSNMRTRVT
jgi:NACHT domain